MSIAIQICDTPEGVAQKAAASIARQIQQKPDAVLGLATGSTPILTYAELVRLHREQHVSFAQTTAFNLDEYVGLSGNHDQSYRYFMQHHLFDHIDIQSWNTYVLNGKAVDAQAECQAFELKIRACGGIDLWLIGIGRNGHIAFNEPGSTSDSRTRIIDLLPDTILTNSRFFTNPGDVPKHALTVGVGTICDARQVVLLATGKDKADAIDRAVNGPIGSQCPASFLQNHPACTIILDKEAASKL